MFICHSITLSTCDYSPFYSNIASKNSLRLYVFVLSNVSMGVPMTANKILVINLWLHKDRLKFLSTQQYVILHKKTPQLLTKNKKKKYNISHIS